MKVRYRPPVDEPYYVMLLAILKCVNKKALFPLSLHTVLLFCIERAYLACYPDRKIPPTGRPPYHEIDF